MLLPYENHIRNNNGFVTISKPRKPPRNSPSVEEVEKLKENHVALSFDPSDVILPREADRADLHHKHNDMTLPLPSRRHHEMTSSGPPRQEILQNAHHHLQENIISTENLSISLMMSKQRGRPSKKFRSQIERLRTRQTIQLAEEEEHHHHHPQHRNNTHQLYYATPAGHGPVGGIGGGVPKHGRFPPRKHWVNELNVDIASRRHHPEGSSMSSPVYRPKERDNHQQHERRRNSSSSDVELISPRHAMDVHSPLRQGRRIYPSTKEPVGVVPKGLVPDAFVPILPKTMKPQHQPEHLHLHEHHPPHTQQQQQYINKQRDVPEIKIKSVRSLGPPPPLTSPQSQSNRRSQSSSVEQYVHYPYSGATVTSSYDYAPTRYFSLSDANKLVQVSSGNSKSSNTKKGSNQKSSTGQKNAFRDATFSMRTFQHEHQQAATPENNTSYKIKSAALKNHEPYIIHHPSHLNRAYREIPGQYPVIYTHQPIATAGLAAGTRYAVKSGDYPPPNVGFVYEHIHPRYERISPRNDAKISSTSRAGGECFSMDTAYAKYIDSPPATVSIQKWTEMQKVGGNA